jgi:hypothetical protein
MERRTTRSKPDKSKRSQDPALSGLVKAAIERQIKTLGKTAQKNSVSDEYISLLTDVMERYLEDLLRRMSIVSQHRASLRESDMGQPSTKIEDFLLFKEDCADYMRKVFSNPEFRSDAPKFNQDEYASHALEEEQRMVLTAQSVRRLCGRDLLVLLIADKSIPRTSSEKIVNRIAFNELRADYVNS